MRLNVSRPPLALVVWLLVALPLSAESNRSGAVAGMQFPVADPLYVAAVAHSELTVGTVKRDVNVGALTVAIMNANGEELLEPLRAKLGDRSFSDVLKSTLAEQLDPALFGARQIGIGSETDAPEGARVLNVAGDYILSRNFKTFAVRLDVQVCDRVSVGTAPCKSVYRNNFSYEYGLPDDAAKLWRKGPRAERWSRLDEERLSSMIVEGFAGAIKMLNYDIASFGVESRKSEGSVRHAIPEGAIVPMRVIRDERDRMWVRAQPGPMFSVESRLAEP